MAKNGDLTRCKGGDGYKKSIIPRVNSIIQGGERLEGPGRYKLLKEFKTKYEKTEFKRRR